MKSRLVMTRVYKALNTEHYQYALLGGDGNAEIMGVVRFVKVRKEWFTLNNVVYAGPYRIVRYYMPAAGPRPTLKAAKIQFKDCIGD